MPMYEVIVDRTSVRSRVLYIEADDESDAETKAIEKAGDIDFSTVSEAGVEYEVINVEIKDE